MMVTNNIIVLLFITLLCIMIHKSYSFENDDQEIMDDIIMESPPSKPIPSFIDQNLPMDKSIDLEIPSFLNNRRSESAEKYFSWARKTNRPVEFLRGKRFWLFAKKDENGMNADVLPPTNTHQNSLTQGLWRSGIVGRRRRRR